MVTQLPPQLVAYASTQVNVSNGDDINSGNDEFHGKGSHVKSEQTARVAAWSPASYAAVLMHRARPWPAPFPGAR